MLCQSMHVEIPAHLFRGQTSMVMPRYFGGGPVVYPLGGSGGFTISYDNLDVPTLNTLRTYQGHLRASGWMSRLDVNSSAGSAQLHVFTPADLPAFTVGPLARHGY